jgi:hypothetical protein
MVSAVSEPSRYEIVAVVTYWMNSSVTDPLTTNVMEIVYQGGEIQGST